MFRGRENIFLNFRIFFRSCALQHCKCLTFSSSIFVIVLFQNFRVLRFACYNAIFSNFHAFFSIYNTIFHFFFIFRKFSLKLRSTVLQPRKNVTTDKILMWYRISLHFIFKITWCLYSSISIGWSPISKFIAFLWLS